MVAGPFVGKTVYLDANPIIYAFENPRAYPGLINHLIAPLDRGEIRVVTSTITLTEVLMHPIKAGDTILENAYRRFLVPADFFEIMPVDIKIAEHAAALRAQFGLRTPDAIHVSTYVLATCDVFLTRDRALERAGIRVVSPDSL